MLLAHFSILFIFLTCVLACSFVNTEDVLLVAGAHSTTIPPHLIEALSLMPADPTVEPPYQPLPLDPSKRRTIDEETFRQALDGNPEIQRKTKEAVALFLSFEIKLEELVKAHLAN